MIQVIDPLASHHAKSSSTQEAQKSLRNFLSFSVVPSSSHLLAVVVTVDNPIVAAIHRETVELFRQRNFEGFDANQIPTEYLEENYTSEINGKVKSYLFKHLIIDFLITELIARKIPIANYPRLTKIDLIPAQKMVFSFDVSIADQIELKEWKNFAFKSPKRKKYKDLDKQVMAFIDHQLSGSKKQQADVLEENDWVLFDATLLDKNQARLANQITGSFWLKIKNNDIADSFKTVFLNKMVGEHFVTNHFDFDDSNTDFEHKRYNFLITIQAIIKGVHLSIEPFKSTFKLKSKADIHNKLMEVFSYRNDVSQRKTIIEEIFHLLLAKHRFEVPKHLILRREEDILITLMKQPDYQVYRAQKDFLSHVELLAEKQLKEEIIIDQIAHNENMKIETRDMQNYLHLFNNKRLREFIYFKPQLDRLDEIDQPINASILGQTSLREKTLNHIIHTLTK